MDDLKSIQRVADALSSLPSIGKRSAEKMAYALLDFPEEEYQEIVDSLVAMKQSVSICPVCGNYIEDGKCPICDDESRDKTTIMVVSYPKDIITIEKNNLYHGEYHVLNGVINTSKGIYPDQLNVSSLLERVKKNEIKEVIIATNPTPDGQTTALYIAKLLSELPVNVTQLAYGLPSGGNIEYADALTLEKALEGRTKL
ncbi:MAG: recombination mediator RecR [Coprobacillus sp.]|nr:recombination mediator RecR [Coprobacillus sp.]